MPDLLQPPTHAANNPVLLADAAARWDEDPDFALGCECADPALQIEQWCQETVATAGATH
ncbi:hypothetical protein [Ramlibacter albus]|uniref:Uncharacterized protein n=1 Tax=Ramlibacter albus TaxID=2079448 RepID=A0A923MD91_9BURK|nr:hypothetical protein [Ramlibacter albus]MBC5767396.1 hypothetical protein [Ramlibacter albus]